MSSTAVNFSGSQGPSPSLSKMVPAESIGSGSGTLWGQTWLNRLQSQENILQVGDLIPKFPGEQFRGDPNMSESSDFVWILRRR